MPSAKATREESRLEVFILHLRIVGPFGELCHRPKLEKAAERLADKLRAPKATGSFIGLLGGVIWCDELR
jgi:hypothetical protein